MTQIYHAQLNSLNCADLVILIKNNIELIDSSFNGKVLSVNLIG